MRPYFSRIAPKGLWVRYGGEPITPEEVEFAARRYAVALLQPEYTDVAARLKEINPRITVLCYKCLSSTRSYETKAPFTSGVSFAEAEAAETEGQEWFARRVTGERIEWKGYPGHFQMKVWNPAYRERWVQNICAQLEGSSFDGVLADNDIYGDYYGLNVPIRDARSMDRFHKGLDLLIKEAGKALNARGKIIVPNIAESRMAPGKWERHSAYGGGFEEVFLGWSATDFLDQTSALAQMKEMMGEQLPVEVTMPDGTSQKRERLTVLRGSTDGQDSHPNFIAALAALWVFSGGKWTAVSAGSHDGHNDTPWIEEQAWDLSKPKGHPEPIKGAWVREFEDGWAAVNLTDHESGELAIPANLYSVDASAPATVVLPPHAGVIYRTSDAEMTVL